MNGMNSESDNSEFKNCTRAAGVIHGACHGMLGAGPSTSCETDSTASSDRFRTNAERTVVGAKTPARGGQLSAASLSRSRATAQAARGGRSKRPDRRSGRRNSSADVCLERPAVVAGCSPSLDQHGWSSTCVFTGVDKGDGASGAPFEQFSPRHGHAGRGASVG